MTSESEYVNCLALCVCAHVPAAGRGGNASAMPLPRSAGGKAVTPETDQKLEKDDALRR
jgi:hypothetical protein